MRARFKAVQARPWASVVGRPWRRGFTLVEILVVLAVIAVLALLTVPSINGVLRSTNLSSSGRQLVDQCALAKQTAHSKNTPVEVRLYKLSPYNASPTATPEVFRAFQLFLAGDSKVPITKPEYFKVPVIISAGTSESALLADVADSASSHKLVSPTADDPKLGVHGSNYEYVAFQFFPSGATDLVAGKNFVTLILQNEKTLAEGGNFYTVQVDPVNGSVRSFRP